VERSTLQGELLGRMQVTVDDRPTVAAWPRPAARRLVALLLLASDHALAREVVATSLFDHLEPSRAARAVSKALSLARSVLDVADPTSGPAASGPSVLDADRASVWIADHVSVRVDLHDHLTALRAAPAVADPSERARRLRDALAVTGPVLLDDRYEPWAQDPIAEVERARREARLTLARATGAIEDWRAVAADDPTSEEACAAIVSELLRAGRRNDAARTVATTRAALAELGVPLSPALEQAVGRATPPTTRVTAGASLDTPEPTTSGAGSRGWPLIGRGRELDVLLRAVRPAADGYGGALLIAAPAGMGKTHLLRHATECLTAEGWAVAAAAAVPDDRLAPFASLRTALLPHGDQRLGPLVARVLHPERAATSAPLHAADLAPLTDALRRHLDGVAATRPLVLCLDDIQWADDAMQRVLARLVAGFGPRRWSLLLAARSDEPTAAIPDLPSTVDRLALRPLTRSASRDLAVHAAASVGIVSEQHAEAIATRGRGNPFFIVELARSLLPDDGAVGPDGGALGSDVPGVPERIVGLLRRRVGACSPAARRLTAFVAVAGEDASLEVVRRSADRLLGDEDVTTVVAELARAALVDEDVDGLRLAHPLLRDAATSAIDPARRAELHALVADALARTMDDGESNAVLSIARHRLAAFEVTGDRRRAGTAVRAAVAGAALARRLAAPAAATELLERALAAWAQVPAADREAVRPAAFAGYTTLGAVCADAGDHLRADEAFGAALTLATTDDEVARAEQAWAQLPYRQGDLDASLVRLEAALDRLAGAGPAARALLLVETGWIRYRRRADDALDVLRRAVELAEATEDWSLRARALDRYGFAMARLVGDHEALPVLEQALRAAERSGDPRERAIVHLHHTRPLYRAGRRYEARTSLARAARLCEQHGFHYLRSVGHWIAADLAEAESDLDAALAERDAELVLLTALDNPRHIAGCQDHRAALLRTLGRPEEAAAADEAAIRAAERLGEPGALTRGEWGPAEPSHEQPRTR
jgi:DNA-binding SARP family transcriptional activator/tetratricopeptide (TPR) repeat protein